MGVCAKEYDGKARSGYARRLRRALPITVASSGKRRNVVLVTTTSRWNPLPSRSETAIS